MRHVTPTLAGLLGLAAATPAQQESWRVDGYIHIEAMSTALVRLPDRTGDGIPELLAGTPGGSANAAFPSPFGGHVRILSGADLSVVLDIDGGAGTWSWDEFGAALAACGDVDGDGLDDFLVGAPNRALVSLRAGSDGHEIRAYAAAGGRFGASVAALGDLDGDSFPDFAVGAPKLAGPGGKLGVVQALSGATGAVLFTFESTVSDRLVGDRERIAAMGDVDGDGRADLGVLDVKTVSAVEYGVARVLSGNGGAELMAVHFDTAHLANDVLRCLAPAGDFDGDGVADLLVGTSSVFGNRPVGYAFSGATGIELLQFLGFDVFVPTWMTVRITGDVDGDGVAEVVIANDAVSGFTSDILLLSGATGAKLGSIGIHGGHGAGGGLALVADSDFDGDGKVDLAFGNPRENGADLNSEGIARTFSWATGKPLATRAGLSSQDRLDGLTRLVGDVDGDGLADFVALHWTNVNTDYTETSVQVRSGRDGAVLSDQRTTAAHLTKVALASLPDRNGDAIDDYVVAFNQEAELRSSPTGAVVQRLTAPSTASWDRGAVIAVGVEPNGSVRVAIADPVSGLGTTGAGEVGFFDAATGALLFQQPGNATSEALGTSLAYLGDVTGDGVGDWAAGAPKNGAAGANAGRVLFLDGATWLALHVSSGAAGNKLGSDLATVGDVDGDGFADLAVSAPGAVSGKGTVSVISTATFATLATFTGAAVSGAFGTFLAAIGDVNGDGAIDWAASAAKGTKVELHDGRTAALLARYDTTDHFMVAVAQLLDREPWTVGSATSGAFPDFVLLDAGKHAAGGALLFAYGDLLAQIEPPAAASGATVTAWLRGGAAGHLTALELVAIDGAPVNAFLGFGSFGALGDWSLSDVVPPGLAGTTWTLRGWAISWNGKLVASKEQTLAFE